MMLVKHHLFTLYRDVNLVKEKLLEIIKKIKELIDKNDLYYYIDYRTWYILTTTIQNSSNINYIDILHQQLKDKLYVIETYSNFDKKMEYIKDDINAHSKYIHITHLIMNHYSDDALSVFNDLLWEEKVWYCRFILGDNYELEVK